MIFHDKIAELHERGYCILSGHFPKILIDDCREVFWQTLLNYLDTHTENPNRGTCRHFLPMTFEPPCFAPQFFFDSELLSIVRGTMDDRVAADQWGCDVPLKGSDYQQFHIDYQRPLFAEMPDLSLPTYMLIVSFGLVQINTENGPIEIAPGTHKLPRKDAIQAVTSGKIESQEISLNIGDILIRHPWALHRGTPNRTEIPRPLLTIRFVRRWYSDDSREVNSIPVNIWQSLNTEQQSLLRFPIGI